eukprot:TRINITY_DN10964_c0_g2_i1.p1 TRINITY_DN10964_c0_g2~~TRINITY_DN10964_c0_g2_i1.p1  ORF type:complete len:266 (+),score=36.56 TRINITY_DN10964_c0_g2_i1:501-1298(+)
MHAETGRLWGWGSSSEGQLGLGSRIPHVPSPVAICLGFSQHPSFHDRSPSTQLCQGSLLECVAPPPKSPGDPIDDGPTRVATADVLASGVACGARHSAVVSADGEAVWTCGWGLYGQCGHGSTDDALTFRQVAALGGLRVASVAAGLWHTACSTDSGDVYTWGGNQAGQLGTGEGQGEVRPRLVEAPSLEDKHVIQVASGARHTAALTGCGRLYTWGWNKFGQLGREATTSACELPAEVEDHNWLTSVACGWWHTAALANMDNTK